MKNITDISNKNVNQTSSVKIQLVDYSFKAQNNMPSLSTIPTPYTIPNSVLQRSAELREMAKELYVAPVIIRMSSSHNRSELVDLWQKQSCVIVRNMPFDSLCSEMNDFRQLAFHNNFRNLFTVDIESKHMKPDTAIKNSWDKTGIPPIEYIYPMYPEILAYVSWAYLLGCRDSKNLSQGINWAQNVSKEKAECATWCVNELMRHMEQEITDQRRFKQFCNDVKTQYPAYGARPGSIYSRGWDHYKNKLIYEYAPIVKKTA